MKNLENITTTNVDIDYTLQHNGIKLRFVVNKNRWNTLRYNLIINGTYTDSFTRKDDITDALEAFGLDESEIQTLINIHKYKACSKDNLICCLNEKLYKIEQAKMKAILNDILTGKPHDNSFPENKHINFLEQTLKPKISVKEYENLNNHIETEGLKAFYTIECIDDRKEAVNITKFILNLIIKYKKYSYMKYKDYTCIDNTRMQIYIDIVNTHNNDLSLEFRDTRDSKVKMYTNEYISTDDYIAEDNINMDYIVAHNIALHKLDVDGQTLFEDTFKTVDSNKYITSANPTSAKEYLKKPDLYSKQYEMTLKQKVKDKINELTNILLLEYIYHGKLPNISSKTRKLLNTLDYITDTKPNNRYDITEVYKTFNKDKYQTELDSNSKYVKINYEDFFAMLKTLLTVIQ